MAGKALCDPGRPYHAHHRRYKHLLAYKALCWFHSRGCVVTEGVDEEPNDTYVEQLVASAQAAVDELVRRGVADRQRIAVGGHSYGVNHISFCMFCCGVSLQLCQVRQA